MTFGVNSSNWQTSYLRWKLQNNNFFGKMEYVPESRQPSLVFPSILAFRGIILVPRLDIFVTWQTESFSPLASPFHCRILKGVDKYIFDEIICKNPITALCIKSWICWQHKCHLNFILFSYRKRILDKSYLAGYRPCLHKRNTRRETIQEDQVSNASSS